MERVRVRLLVSRSGEDGAQAPGDEILVPQNEVGPMLAAGQCVLAEVSAPPSRARTKERAVKAVTVERAVG